MSPCFKPQRHPSAGSSEVCAPHRWGSLPRPPPGPEPCAQIPWQRRASSAGAGPGGPAPRAAMRQEGALSAGGLCLSCAAFNCAAHWASRSGAHCPGAAFPGCAPLLPAADRPLPPARSHLLLLALFRDLDSVPSPLITRPVTTQSKTVSLSVQQIIIVPTAKACWEDGARGSA